VRLTRLVVPLFGIVLVATILPSAGATPAASNPVAGRPWGIYEGSGDGLWPAYESSTGRTRALLGKEALHARLRSYGSWISTADISGLIAKDIAQEQDGNPDVLVWMQIFRLWPGTEAKNQVPLTVADQQAYRSWIDAAARGIGSAHVGIVLEPDLPLTLGSWGPKVRAGLARYAARELGALPNATVYLDAGSADWLPVSQVVPLLESAGIQYVRGFDLGASHHDSTASEIRYGRSIADDLAKAGYAGKHFVVDTSDNGHAYTNRQFYAKYPKGKGYNANNPPACTSKRERVCVALGIPPTTDVTSSQWKLPKPVSKIAASLVDAFVWIGHPWKIDNGANFNLRHALDAARTDPFF
jgi:endoglucanase